MKPSPDDRVGLFGAAVMRRLADMGRSQAWLAEQFKVSRQSVGEWVRVRIPPPARVFAIEDELGIPGQLAPLAGYSRPGYENDQPDLATVLAADPLLDDEGRQAILAMYRALTRP